MATTGLDRDGGANRLCLSHQRPFPVRFVFNRHPDHLARFRVAPLFLASPGSVTIRFTVRNVPKTFNQSTHCLDSLLGGSGSSSPRLLFLAKMFGTLEDQFLLNFFGYRQ
jgi:hypothetical protein